MITETRGDIFHSDCDAIVIPTNCQGVMGAGLAKQFRDRHPALAKRYKFAAQRGELRIGVVTGERSSVARRNYIFFPTKDQWWLPSKLSYISQGLIALRQYVSESSLRSIALANWTSIMSRSKSITSSNMFRTRRGCYMFPMSTHCRRKGEQIEDDCF